MFKALTERAEELGVQIMYNTKATKILNQDWYVSGVEFVNADGESVVAECNAVIVATGGFGDNPKMINDILWWKQIEEIKFDEFSFEVLDTIKYKKEKMLKILSIISWKKEEKIKNIILKTRDNKDNKTWATQIAKKIQEVLDNLWLTDIEINRHLIQKM